MAKSKLWPLGLLLVFCIGSCLASRAQQDLVLRDDHLRGVAAGARTPVVLHSVRSTPPLQQPASSMNVEFAVDYDDEENDAPYYSDEGPVQQQQQEQAMTYSTYYPAQAQAVVVPCPYHHHRQQQQQDAATLVAAADQAWQKAKQLAGRLSAADAAETQELIYELEATLDEMDAAQHAADDLIDHRWEEFDEGVAAAAAAAAAHADGDLDADDADDESYTPEVLMAGGDYFEPLHDYVSGLDDYVPDEDDARDLRVEDDLEAAVYGGSSSEFFDTADGLLVPLPADPTSSSSSDDEGAVPDDDDIGLFIFPADNTVNNLALFGVRTPAEVAAAAAAAAPGAQYGDDVDSSSWSGLLEWLSHAPYEPVDAQRAAAVLIVGCTLMVLVAFLFNLVELRATVQAAAAAGDSSSANDSSNSMRYVSVPAGAISLRTRKSGGFATDCGAVAAAAAAAAAAAMGAGFGGQQQQQQWCNAVDDDDLSMPLLLDADELDDVEAAVLEPTASAVLPPTFQRFYNPMHYQQLPGGAE